MELSCDEISTNTFGNMTDPSGGVKKKIHKTFILALKVIVQLLAHTYYCIIFPFLAQCAAIEPFCNYILKTIDCSDE